MDASNILEDLDRRQNDVLDQLDELNQRVETLLKEWLASREKEDQDAAQPEAEQRPAVEKRRSARA